MLIYVTKQISFSVKTTLNMRVSCNCKGITNRILIGAMLVKETVSCFLYENVKNLVLCYIGLIPKDADEERWTDKNPCNMWMEGFKKLTYLFSQQLGINTATLHTIPRKAFKTILWDV